MARTVKEWVGRTDDAMPHRAVRLRLFLNSDGECGECGIKIGPKEWHADHIIRLKDGGENRETNLQVLCVPCHRGKTGLENKAGAKAARVRMKNYSIKKKPAFSWQKKWKRKVDGTVVRRDEE